MWYDLSSVLQGVCRDNKASTAVTLRPIHTNYTGPGDRRRHSFYDVIRQKRARQRAESFGRHTGAPYIMIRHYFAYRDIIYSSIMIGHWLSYRGTIYYDRLIVSLCPKSSGAWVSSSSGIQEDVSLKWRTLNRGWINEYIVVWEQLTSITCLH